MVYKIPLIYGSNDRFHISLQIYAQMLFLYLRSVNMFFVTSVGIQNNSKISSKKNALTLIFACSCSVNEYVNRISPYILVVNGK